MEKLSARKLDHFRDIAGLRSSPTGETLAFCRSWTCTEKNMRCSGLYSLDLNTGKVRHISKETQIWSFCYDREGMLLFPIDIGGKNPSQGTTRFRQADPHTGETTEAFTIPLVGACPCLWRKEDRLIVSAEWDLELDRLTKAGDKDRIQAHLNGDIVVCDELPYRLDGHGYINKLRSRLYEYTVSTGELVSVTPPNFKVIDFDVADEVLYVMGESYDVKTAMEHKVFRWDGTEFAYEMDCGGMMVALAAAPSGLYAATDMLMDREDVYIYSGAYQRPKMEMCFKTRYALFNHISTDISRFEDKEFMFAGTSLYYTMQNRRGVQLYRWKAGEENRLCPEDTIVLHYDVGTDGRVFAACLPEMGCPEVYELLPDEARRLTNFTQQELSDFQFSKPEHMVFQGAYGDEIDGWVIPPADYEEGKQYPAILSIHGGPQLRFCGSLYFEHQCWAAKDYYVMYCNPHGSIGDSADFSNLRKAYATVDYEDIMKFVDLVLERYPQISPHRLGVTGISYGGFMTNWIVTHSDRFAAAASQAGISDWISLYATDDTLNFDLIITGSRPWDDIHEHWRISPLAYADRCKTPTLFVECGEDYRCPVDQGLGLYQSFMEMGVPTKAVIVNGESHCIFHYGKPRSRIYIAEEITNWFERYIPNK